MNTCMCMFVCGFELFLHFSNSVNLSCGGLVLKKIYKRFFVSIFVELSSFSRCVFYILFKWFAGFTPVRPSSTDRLLHTNAETCLACSKRLLLFFWLLIVVRQKKLVLAAKCLATLVGNRQVEKIRHIALKCVSLLCWEWMYVCM